MNTKTRALPGIVVAVLLAACVPDAMGSDGGLAGIDAGPIADGGSAGPTDTRTDAAIDPVVADCTRRCLDIRTRCGSSGAEEIDCGRLCATYYSDIATGCETEREAYFACGEATCSSCSTESDELVSCIVARASDPCFVYCRAAMDAGCAPGTRDPEDCNCIAVHYETAGNDRCRAEFDAYFACAAAAPCDRDVACAAEIAALNTCGLGCASGQVGCYVGRTGRCIDETALQADPENCGGCNRSCADGSCIDGACVCAAGSHVCPDGSCYADNDIFNCGTSCASCPPPPPNGTAACTDGVCRFACNAGYVIAGDACVRGCASGEHLCGDGCFSDDDPEHCGPSCVPCTAAIANAHATCVAGACASACDVGYVPVAGACLACDPLTGAGCAATEWCYSTGGGLFCIAPGGGADGSPCTALNDCTRGFLCVNFPTGSSTCRRICDAAVAGSCTAPARCVALSGVTPATLGACLP